MAKLHLMSDLHLEFHRDRGQNFLHGLRPEGVDIVVLAGDICAGESIAKVLRDFSQMYPQVVYCPGNHEFYGNSPKKVQEVMDRASEKYDNVHILSPGKEVKLYGKRFIGATGWFPQDDFTSEMRRELSDFKYIKDYEPWVYEQCEAWRKFYTEYGKAGDIVIMHHLPCHGSIHPMFTNDPFNAFFLNDISELIEKNKPDYVFHGHTHFSFDYMFNDYTRIVARPFGYPGEASAFWEPQLINF